MLRSLNSNVPSLTLVGSHLHAPLLVALVATCCGCSGQVKPGAVGLDPPEVATAIIAEFDKDGDGALSKSEIKASRSLSSVASNELNPLDVNQDGTVTSDELEAKIQDFVDVNRASFRCYVFYRGQPLKGAEVRFVPEAFMGSSLSEATGTTDAEGIAEIEDGGEFGGLVSGLYKVEITHPVAKISPDFNTETTLGVAVDGTNPYVEPARFKVR